MPKSPRVTAIRRQYYSMPGPHQVYYERLAGKLKAHPGAAVLNIGCGTGHNDRFDWAAHKDSVQLIGLDVDAGAAANPYIQSFVLAREADDWDIPAESIDFATCRSVLEHVQSPAHFFANLRRVLKPGGEFLFITPNILHPAMLASALLPNRLKTALLLKATGRSEEDIFPTVYRLNTRRAVERSAREFGFAIDELLVGEWSPTNYLDFSLVTFRLAEGYYNLVTKTGLEKHFGINIIGLLRKEKFLAVSD
jgi:SAM-dependent methyltransferase